MSAPEPNKSEAEDPEEYEEDDPMIDEIRRNPMTRKYADALMSLFPMLMVISGMFVTFGLFAIFYDNKLHLIIMGVICAAHLASSYYGRSGLLNGNRYHLLVFVMANIVWLGAIALLLIIFIFGGSTI